MSEALAIEGLDRARVARAGLILGEGAIGSHQTGFLCFGPAGEFLNQPAAARSNGDCATCGGTWHAPNFVRKMYTYFIQRALLFVRKVTTFTGQR